MKHKNLTPTGKALLTWYTPDNPKYKDPLHPTLKLAGEIGELLDLYAKNLFKPNFDWHNCKWCKKKKTEHNSFRNYRCVGKDYLFGKFYTSKVLDELGDIWYYLRILFWIYDLELKTLPGKLQSIKTLDCIIKMYHHASILIFSDQYGISLYKIYEYLAILLSNLNCTFEQLTELNYQKLNSEETNNGWKDAK